jgi:hypothetical protein
VRDASSFGGADGLPCVAEGMASRIITSENLLATPSPVSQVRTRVLSGKGLQAMMLLRCFRSWS